MDYAHTHSSMDIRKYIHSRGYQCVYLTLYFPKLNPIGQFCSVDKDKVKRNKFLKKESLMARIGEACDVLYLSEFKYIVSYSTKCFGECLYKERLYFMSTPGNNSIGSLFSLFLSIFCYYCFFPLYSFSSSPYALILLYFLEWLYAVISICYCGHLIDCCALSILYLVLRYFLLTPRIFLWCGALIPMPVFLNVFRFYTRCS